MFFCIQQQQKPSLNAFKVNSNSINTLNWFTVCSRWISDWCALISENTWDHYWLLNVFITRRHVNPTHPLAARTSLRFPKSVLCSTLAWRSLLQLIHLPPPSSVQERGTRSTSEEFKFSRPSRRQTRSASKEQMQRQSVVNFTFAIVKGKRGLETTNAPRRRKSRRTDFKIKREKMTRSVFHMKGQIGPVAQRHLFCDPNETGKEERWKRRAARNGAVNTEAYPPYKMAFM